MAQRASGYVRIEDERYETVEAWPVLALLSQLPNIGWAWDPCDDGDGHLIAALHRQGIKAIGSGSDFLCIAEPPMAGVTDLIVNPPYGAERRGELAIAFIRHALALPVPRISMLLPIGLRFREHAAGRVPVLRRIYRQDRVAQPHPVDCRINRIAEHEPRMVLLGQNQRGRARHSLHLTKRGGAMTKYLGIDPGLSGALAIVETFNGVPALIDVIDMPSAGTGSKTRVDAIAAAEWIAKYAVSAAFIERAQAFPGQGSSSGFVYGRSVGSIEAVVALLRIPYSFVEAAGWKRKLHLDKDKELARQKALQLFPSQHALLALKRWHGRAEAALIVVASLERAP
jgi:crossover junction endodeoxyribonuclease RuvC